MRHSQTARFAVFCFVLVLITSTRVFAAGDLDTTFTAGVTTFGSTASVVEVQTDGRVLVGGDFRVVNGRSSPGLVRLNADGTIDQSFSIGTGFNLGANVNAIAVQTDGKILVGGRFIEFNGPTLFHLVRLNSDGSLDTTFNMGGTGIDGFDVGAIALQANGQILVGGDFSSYNGVTTGRLARLNSDGSLDTTFATNLGTGFDQRVYSIAVESDGQIVVGGNFSNVNGTPAKLIARLNGSGTVDTAFTTNGGTGFPGFFVFKVLLQTNGQILVGGRFDEFNGTPRTDLLRLNADGSLDTNFNPAANGNVLDLLIQANGQIIAAGITSFGAMQERTYIARLNQADGSLDSTFDAGTTFFNTNGAISSIAFQLDGSIFAAGNFITFSGVVRSALANLNGTTGSLNAGFTTVIGAGGQVNDLLVLPDNKILIAGLFSGVNESFRESVARLNADGSTDTTFNAGAGAVSGGVNTLAVQPLDGKIIVGGSFQMFGGENRLGIVRLNTDGSLDATFNVSVSIFVEAVALQPDGKIVIGGGFNVARLNADGTTDATFNSGTGFDGNVDAVILQSNGQILVGGSFTTYNGTAGVNDLARLNSNGTLDAAFSTNIGTGTDGGIYTLALQTDGKIVAAGFFSNFNGTIGDSIARLNTTGTLDGSFNVGTGFSGNVNDLALQPDGRILAVGSFGDYNGTVRIELARLNTNGSLDTSFTSGVGFNQPLNAVGVQCDGRILIGGLLETYGGVPRFGIARVTAGDTITWTGAADMNWNNGANWSTGFVPASTDNAVIPNNFTVNLSGGNFSVLTWTVGTNSTLTIAAGSSLTTELGTNDGAISGAGTLNVIGTTLTNNGTISVAAVNVNLNMNCAGFNPLQTKFLIGSGSFVGNTLTIAFGVTLSLQGDHQFHVINLQGTLDATSRVVSLRGANPLQGAGSIILTFGTIIYDGAAAQTIAALTYNNLTLNNAAGASLGGSVTVGGTLTLTAGTLNVGANTLTLNSTVSSSGGSFTSAANGTVNYNQGSNGQAVVSGNYGNLTFSNFNKNLSNAAIGIAGTFTPGSATGHTITGSTFDFNGAAAQTVPAFNYNNLTSSNIGARTLAGSGTIRIAGAFTPGTNTYTVTGSTLEFNGAAAQTIPVFTFNNLTLNNAAGASLGGNVTVGGALNLQTGTLAVGSNTLTLNGAVSSSSGNFTSAADGTVNYNQGSNGQAVLSGNYGNLTFSNFSKNLTNAVIGIAGVFTPGSGSHTITGSTFVYNGTAAQTLPSGFTTYNNLTLNNAAGVTGFAGLIVQGLLSVQQGTFVSSSDYTNVQIDGGAILAGTNATTINVSGNWTNNGAFTANGNTVNFNGSVAQNIGGASATTFNNLIINNPAGVSLNANVTVDGALTLTAGTLAVGSNTLTLNGAVSATGGSLSSNAGGTVNYNQPSNGQNVLAGNYGNLTFSNFNKVLPASTIGIAGTFTPGSATGHTISGNTIDFNDSGAQTVPIFNYFNLTVSGNRGGATITFAPGLIGVAGTLSAPVTNASASFAGNTIVLNGSGSPQTIAHEFAFNNLTIDNTSGVNSNANQTVTGTLALNSGDLNMTTFILTMPNSATSTGNTDVVGNMMRTGFVAGGTPLGFGNPLNTIRINSGAVPSAITVNLAKSAPADFPSAVQRTYTITPNGANGPATLRLHYLDSELGGNIPESDLNLRRFNGTGWAPVIATSSNTGDALNNWLENDAVATFSQWTFSTFTPTASNGSVSGRILTSEGTPLAGAVVRLAGTQNRKFITDANGFYRFENVGTNGFYTVTPSRVNYSFSPSSRSFSLLGQTTEAAFDAMATGQNANPLDTPEYLVRQHYLDFLGREPDESGFNFWSDQILECGNDNTCIERRRENVSAAYFLSIEFQQTGGLVDGLYRASYGVRPNFGEFMPDTRAVGLGVVVGTEGWQARLQVNKTAFVTAFANRPAFHATYDGMDNSQFVETLIGHAGVTFTTAERDALVSRLTNGTQTRADVLRSIAENDRFVTAKFNEAFVMMEYFGYLRRDPDANGYAFWLNKLNEFNGNFEQAEMVKAFIVSGEYRQRFGP